MRYLGRYTHRVGISNSRLVSLGERGVTFRTKNGKTLTLDPVTFLGRFVQHVLPPRFVKIRHYGLVAPAHVVTSLAAARAALSRGATPETDGITSVAPRDPARAPGPAELEPDWLSLLCALTGTDLRVCRACGARARVRRALTAARSPPAEAA